MSRFCRTLTLAILLHISWTSANPAAISTPPAAGSSLKTHDGRTVNLAELRGRQGVILFFFTTWCPGCRDQIPDMKALAAAGKERNVAVYGISLQETEETVKEYVEYNQVEYPVIMDFDLSAARSFGVSGIPTFIALDLQGRVAYREHVPPEDVPALLAKLTAGN